VIFEDENGKIIFTEYAIHTASFERKYNLSELEKGQYILKIKTDTITQVLPITITDKELKMDWEAMGTL
jgi:hypothetical protein